MTQRFSMGEGEFESYDARCGPPAGGLNVTKMHPRVALAPPGKERPMGFGVVASEGLVHRQCMGGVEGSLWLGMREKLKAWSVG